MTPCSGCGRLLQTGDANCPFCGQAHRAASAAVVLIGLALGCGPTVGGTGMGDATTSADSGPSTTVSSSAEASTTTIPVGSTGFDTQTSAGDSTSDGTGNSSAIYGGPVTDPDGGGITLECSVFSQDCSDGEKCMPWANDGGDVWNAARCVLVADDPAAVDQPCTAMESFTSGVDTCDVGLVCIGSDAETLEGVCVALCGGSDLEPTCDEGTCVGFDSVIPLCRPTCDPLAGDCADGETCLPSVDDWGCLPAGGGMQGETCESVNACGQGLICLDADGCSAVCDLSVAQRDAACQPGEVCTPLYEDGTAPDAHDDVGVCGSPG